MSVAVLYFLLSAAGLTALTLPFFPSTLPIKALVSDTALYRRPLVSATYTAVETPRNTSQQHTEHIHLPHILPLNPPLFLVPLPFFPPISFFSLVMQGIALLYSNLIYHCLPSQPDSGRAAEIQSECSLPLSLYLNQSHASFLPLI